MNEMYKQALELYKRCIIEEVKYDFKKVLPKHLEPIVFVDLTKDIDRPQIKTTLVCMN